MRKILLLFGLFTFLFSFSVFAVADNTSNLSNLSVKQATKYIGSYTESKYGLELKTVSVSGGRKGLFYNDNDGGIVITAETEEGVRFEIHNPWHKLSWLYKFFSKEKQEPLVLKNTEDTYLGVIYKDKIINEQKAFLEKSFPCATVQVETSPDTRTAKAYYTYEDYITNPSSPNTILATIQTPNAVTEEQVRDIIINSPYSFGGSIYLKFTAADTISASPSDANTYLTFFAESYNGKTKTFE